MGAVTSRRCLACFAAPGRVWGWVCPLPAGARVIECFAALLGAFWGFFGELTEVLLGGFFAFMHSKLNFVSFFLETLALFSQLSA